MVNFIHKIIELTSLTTTATKLSLIYDRDLLMVLRRWLVWMRLTKTFFMFIQQ